MKNRPSLLIEMPDQSQVITDGFPMTPPTAFTPLENISANGRRYSDVGSCISSDADEDDSVRDESDWTMEEDDTLLQTYLDHLSSPPRRSEPPAAPFSMSSPPFNVIQRTAKSTVCLHPEIFQAHSFASIRKRLMKVAKERCAETSGEDKLAQDVESEEEQHAMSETRIHSREITAGTSTALNELTSSSKGTRLHPYHRTHNRNASLRRLHLQKDLQLNIQNAMPSLSVSTPCQQPLASPFHEKVVASPGNQIGLSKLPQYFRSKSPVFSSTSTPTKRRNSITVCCNNAAKI